tara:strand:- start:83054 stop:83239 length:186 start_codon:yes stop_codon:yes gene_type:complete
VKCLADPARKQARFSSILYRQSAYSNPVHNSESTFTVNMPVWISGVSASGEFKFTGLFDNA